MMMNIMFLSAKWNKVCYRYHLNGVLAKVERMNSSKWLATKQTGKQTKQLYSISAANLLRFIEFSCQLISILYDLNWIVLATSKPISNRSNEWMNEWYEVLMRIHFVQIFQWNQVLDQWTHACTLIRYHWAVRYIDKWNSIGTWLLSHSLIRHAWDMVSSNHFILYWLSVYVLCYMSMLCRPMNRITTYVRMHAI